METTLFTVIVLIFSVVIHEVAHGWAANALGDPTAKLQGRLTLNPIKHADPIGSVLIPGVLVLTGSSFLFGWAKPVPYNPNNLRKGRSAEFIVSAAGIGTNLLMAVLFSGVAALAFRLGNEPFAQLAIIISIVNLSLSLFNLLPLPPFDGYKMLGSLAPTPLFLALRRFEDRLRNFEIVFLILILFLFSQVLGPVFGGLVRSVTEALLGFWLSVF
jgi:Zn-dependent protease